MAKIKDTTENGEVRKVKKVSTNKYSVEVSSVVTTPVDMKILKNEIKELQDDIAHKREIMNLDFLESELEKKEELLTELNSAK